jgi:hypothetical protein
MTGRIFLLMEVSIGCFMYKFLQKDIHWNIFVTFAEAKRR